MTSPFRKFAAEVCFGEGASKRFARGECPSCGCKEAAATIRDPLSRKEYHISGLCQNCQDDVFGSKPPSSELKVRW